MALLTDEAHIAMKEAFPNEQGVVHGHVRSMCKRYSMEALNIVWERFQDCNQSQDMPPDYLDMQIVGPWLPRMTDLPLQRFVKALSADEVEQGLTLRTDDVVYHDVYGRRVPQPSVAQRDTLRRWDDKYGRLSSAPRNLGFQTQQERKSEHGEESTAPEQLKPSEPTPAALAQTGPTTPRRQAPSQPLEGALASPWTAPTDSSSSPASKPSDKSRSSRASLLSRSSQAASYSTARTSDPGTSTSHESKGPPGGGKSPKAGE